MPLESGTELSVVAWAEDRGAEVRKVVYPGRRGCPDRVFHYGGQSVWVEFKKPGKTFDPHQERERRRLQAVGIVVHLVDGIEDGIALLERTLRL